MIVSSCSFVDLHMSESAITTNGQNERRKEKEKGAGDVGSHVICHVCMWISSQDVNMNTMKISYRYAFPSTCACSIQLFLLQDVMLE